MNPTISPTTPKTPCTHRRSGRPRHRRCTWVSVARQRRADGRPDRRGRVRQVAGAGRGRHPYAVGSRRRFRRPVREPPQQEGRRRRPPLRPPALRDRRIARARRAADGRRRGHAVVRGAQAGRSQHRADGACRRALGGLRRAGREGTPVPLHAGDGKARQVEHAGRQRLACAIGRRQLAGRGHRHRRQSGRLSDPRPDRRADRGRSSSRRWAGDSAGTRCTT